MDAPSSPILPPLPDLPAATTIPLNDRGRPKRPTLNTRKRTFSSHLRSSSLPSSAASSDPALFSGDDEPPAAENYGAESSTTKRKKKIMYSGSWFSHRTRAGREERKREFKRNVDSGIFMAGDGDAEDGDVPSSDSLGSLEAELMRDLEGSREKSLGLVVGSQDEVVRESRLRWRRSLLGLKDGTGEEGKEEGGSLQHEQVRNIVRQHLDAGNEDVELSRMDLTDLPIEIAELATLSTQPNLVPGMLDIGRPFETNLKLMLCNNLIRDFPRPILEVSNLKVLSLRQNRLRSIPGSIRRLTNLVRLSVGGNKLSHLPFEILELAHFHKLRVLHAQPNPWDLSGVEPKNMYKSIEVVSTRTSLPVTPSTQHGGVANLTETTLRALYRLFPNLTTPQFDLKDLLPPYSTPEAVLSSLDTLEAVQREGGPRLCTFCKRMMVQPGEEWLEYWAINHPNSDNVFVTYALREGQDLIPFRRMSCGSGCEGKENAWVERWQEWQPKEEGEGVVYASAT